MGRKIKNPKKLNFEFFAIIAVWDRYSFAVLLPNKTGDSVRGKSKMEGISYIERRTPPNLFHKKSPEDLSPNTYWDKLTPKISVKMALKAI